jgi:hypothetical protein
MRAEGKGRTQHRHSCAGETGHAHRRLGWECMFVQGNTRLVQMLSCTKRHSQPNVAECSPTSTTPNTLNPLNPEPSQHKPPNPWALPETP